jgi:glycosyltransferase involved in cell wall biosynthesis
MNIVLFIPSFERGGTERNVVLLSRTLINFGYRVDLIYIRKSNGLFDEIDSNTRKIELKNKINIPLIHPRLNDAINIFFQFLKYLKANINRVKLVLSFQSSIIAIFVCMFLRVPIIVRVANSIDYLNYERKLVSRLSHILKKWVYKWADIIITNSNRTASDLTRLLGRKVECIYNPTFDHTIVEKARENVNHDWFRKKELPIVIGVGRLVRQKDFETLIRAFAEVRKSMRVRLVILGEGEERRELERLVETLGIEEDVWMPGFVNNPYKYMARSDLFVLSSLYEGLPNALIEAVGVGVPVVSTNCLSGPEEILLGGEGGDLVDVGDLEGMACAIRRNLVDRDYAIRKWRVAYANLYRFTPEEVGKKYLKLIEEII